ncbi:MAG: hypothetical protein NE327_05235 [Lentisphaeraceae bacterium]|nr:hypothetical protein [Lentisphaeraceae bacterium]
MNRILTPEQAANSLLENGFPTIFCEILKGTHKKHGTFHIYFEKPSKFYELLAEKPEDIPLNETLLPIHESNYSSFVSYEPLQRIFIEHSIERKDYDVIARSFEEYQNYEVDRLIGDGVTPDELLEFGKLLEIKDIEEIVEEFKEEL